MAGRSPSRVRTCRSSHGPLQASRPGSIWTWKRLPRWPVGSASTPPAPLAGRSGTWPRASDGSPGGSGGAPADARPSPSWRAQQPVRRHRQDVHHQTALALVRQDDELSHEAVRVAHLLRNHHLAKSISDAGWGAFLTLLANTAARAGREGVAVDPAFTSQACSGCGVMVHKGLSVRWHTCPACGTSLHRDHNAARNIQWRGQRLRGVPALAGAVNREPVGR